MSGLFPKGCCTMLGTVWSNSGSGSLPDSESHSDTGLLMNRILLINIFFLL